MTFAEIKTQVRSYMTDEQIRAFGDLRRRETWEAALDKCSEAVAIAADAAKVAAVKGYEVATSPKAQEIYRQIITAIVLVIAVIAIGLYRAACYYWAEYGKPGALIVYAYSRDKAVQVRREFRPWLTRCQLALEREWQSLVALALMRWQGLF